MRIHSKALIEIGRYLIVTAIAIIAGVLFNVSYESKVTSININGSLVGFLIALFSIFYLVIIWYKFEIFSSLTEEPKTILILVGTTVTYIVFISGSAILAVDSQYCNPDLRSCKWFSIGLILLYLSDIFLLVGDYKNPNGYIAKLKKPVQINFGGFIIGMRFLFAFGYFGYLNNALYNQTIDNEYIHGIVLLSSIFLAIYAEIKLFPTRTVT